ncbi:complex I NDUFA9 subunit family protein [Halomonas urumqiensis]|uniref:Epimerase n=1 Tax=Halomonas urumqiensis TaxID=1684789 RepID=A0A2N7UKU7_9GAMM|nr:complex I NDUFA9 subunit family protein [Halomonas urumqiensis]PMR81065.1 epimerase [Halomonas urumqiensis]PTB01078.1 complex I NDUFA9 subunit family protein [Halomonas urumqiensis]GHE22803.1 3-beta-hydroxy-Delta(5)-steroid dehydrogenase [Halomonas urumqiensis]
MPQARITVFGGTGFLGREIVRELVESGHLVRLVARAPTPPAWALESDQLEMAIADIRSDADVAMVLEDADAVLNAVSLYRETSTTGFEEIHVEGAGRLAMLAREAGIERLVHVSGIGASNDSPSAYVRARARGEEAVLDAMPRATLLRPSVLFGRDDAFLAALDTLTRLPVVPLFGRGETRLQPVHVIDVARAAARLLAGPEQPRRLFELGGPEVMSYREIVELVMAYRQRQRRLLTVPFWVWRTLASLLSPLPDAPLTRDQVILMRDENQVGDGVGTFADLGLAPRSLRDALPDCLDD